MSDPAPNAELLRSLGQLARGLSALFWGLPRIGSHFGRSLQFSNAVLLSAIQIHHFFVDGVIWRLRNPAARSPLSSSLRAVSGRA